MGDYSLLRGRAMRATRLDGCGEPVLGPDSVIASKGFITAALTANNVAGDTITVTNAAGEECVNDTPIPKFSNYSVVLTFCGVNPALLSMLTGQPVVLRDGAVVGFRQNSKIDVDLIGFALELWTGIAADACDSSGVSYGYILLPFVKGGVVGDITVENAAINFTVTGAVTRNGSGWGVGPYDVVLDDTDAPAPLAEVIDSGDHLHLEITQVPPPDTDDTDPQALGVPATGATAGIPATLTPSNSYPPEDLADAATGFTATPGTAWTTGQYVTLGDGSEANWNGSAWEAGRA